MKKKTEDNQIIEKYGRYAIWVSVFIFWFYGLITYTYNQTSTSNDSVIYSNFGTIGDFIGGILNPILALIGLFALLTTIKLQSKELKLTRKELKKSSKALKEQSDSFKIQNDSIKQQNFENTFFKMIDLHNDIINNLTYREQKVRMEKGDISQYIVEDSSKKVISILLNQFKKNNKTNYINENYDKFYKTYQEKIGHYFGNIYQILKFIDESKIENKKRYSSLFRAQFSVSELELLAYHCLSEIAIEKFKPLIEKYQFLEHIDKKSVLQEVIILYDKKAFGEKVPKVIENN